MQSERGLPARARHRRARGDSVSLRSVRLQHGVNGGIGGGMPAARAGLLCVEEWGTVESRLSNTVNLSDQAKPPLKAKTFSATPRFNIKNRPFYDPFMVAGVRKVRKELGI